MLRGKFIYTIFPSFIISLILGIDSKGTYTFRRYVNNRMAEAGIEIFERALNMGHTPVVNAICYDSPRKSKIEMLEKALTRGPRHVVTPW